MHNNREIFISLLYATYAKYKIFISKNVFIFTLFRRLGRAGFLQFRCRKTVTLFASTRKIENYNVSMGLCLPIFYIEKAVGI